MTASSEQLHSRIASVKQRIERACDASARDPSEVRLIAVSKRQPSSAIAEAYALGVRDFGENYVQELTQKADQLSHLSGLCLHMIGRLQRNKAKHVAPLVAAVHTLDSERLGAELDRQAGKAGRRLSVFLGVNIGGEMQKSGVIPEAVAELVQESKRWKNLSLEGLMCIPPRVSLAEETRTYFRALRELRDAVAPELSRLSMGMSRDFHVAIEEGATDVRVGTALFGERQSVD